MANFYYSHNNQQVGPVSFDQLRVLAAGGQIQPSSLVWQEGTPEWQPASSLPDLFPSQPQHYSAPQPQYGQPATLPYNAPMQGPGLPSGFAVTSLVLGIISVLGVCFAYVGIPLAILAVIFGAIGRSRASSGVGGGKGMATAGLILGVISLVLFVIMIIFFAAIFANLAHQSSQGARTY